MRPHALITGATGGIGRAIALAPTHQLILTGRDRQALSEIAAACPAATAHAADLSSPDDLAALAATVQDLDLLVHSAGVLHMGTTEEVGIERWRESFEVNVLAPVELTRAFLPALRRSEGHVVLINSGLGHRTIAGSGAYSASKFALRAFADALRQEEADNGVRVTSIHPGRVATPMQERLREWEGEDYDGDQWIQPEQIAQTLLSVVNLGSGAIVGSIDIRPAPRTRP